MTLRAPVAQALVDALRAYHDPRDQGGCDHCGYRRLDNNLLCLDCGLPNGLFGQLIAERVARHAEQTATPTTPFGRGRHAHDDGENGPPGSHLPVLPEAKSGS